FDHSADVDGVVLTGTAAIDLLEGALDLDQPMDLTMFNAPFQPARTDYDWLSRDEAIVDAYVADPRCGFGIDTDSARVMFIGARRGADPAQVAAIRSSLPVYIAVGEADPVNGGLADRKSTRLNSSHRGTSYAAFCLKKKKKRKNKNINKKKRKKKRIKKKT